MTNCHHLTNKFKALAEEAEIATKINAFRKTGERIMNSREFCYWLQGWFELNSTIDHRDGATKETLDMIQKHLNMVFVHEIDPSYGDEKEQEKLNKIHNNNDGEPFLVRC